MPTYQYRCADCGQDLEVIQKFTDSALTECPNCQGQLRKVFNAVGVVFKGSGFYSTDNRNGSKGSSNGKSADSGNGTSEKSSTTSSSDSGSSSGSDSGSGSSSGSSKESSSSTAKAPAKAAAD